MVIIINSIWEAVLYAALAAVAWNLGARFYDYLKRRYQEKKWNLRR